MQPKGRHTKMEALSGPQWHSLRRLGMARQGCDLQLMR
jgi:hypothetical protein